MSRISKTDSPTANFSDEKADAVPHQTTDERVHGVEPDREAQDHRGNSGDAQRRDIKVTRQALETPLSGKDLVFDLNLTIQLV